MITKNGREVLKQRGTRTLKNVSRTINYLGKSAYDGEAYFSGKIYALKITQANGTEILNYDINNLLNKKFKDVTITSLNDWNSFVNRSRAGETFFGRKVTLNNTIDLGGANTTSMPNFEGVFDGKGNKIQGLKINGSGEANGLFKNNSGIIQNLNIENGYIYSAYSKTGLIAGTNTGTIDNVTTSGTVSGRNSVGSICGTSLTGSEVSNCTNSASVTGSIFVRRNCWRRRRGNDNVY